MLDEDIMNSLSMINMDENDSIHESGLPRRPQHLHLIEDDSQRLPEELEDERERELALAKNNELLVSMSGQSGSYGTMFDIESVSYYSIEIDSIDIHVNEIMKDCPVRVYFKEGSHIGFEDQPDAWTMVVNGMIECNGFEKRSNIPADMFSKKLKIDGGKRIAIYTTLSTPKLRYSRPSTLQDSNQVGDGIITVHGGTGVGGLFDKFYYPRIFNGVIKYEAQEEKHISLGGDDDTPTKEEPKQPSNICQKKIESEPGLTMEKSLTMEKNGNMFNLAVKADRPVYIQGLEFFTNALNKEVEYYVYTLSGGFQFGMYDLSKWTLVTRGKVKGKGASTATSIPKFNLMLPAGKLQGFYITLTEPTMLNIETDSIMGTNFVEDEYTSMQVGVSVSGFPLAPDINFETRAWYGSLIYSFPGLSCDTNNPAIHSQTKDTSLIFFTFIIKHKSASPMQQLFKQVDSGVLETVSNLLKTDQWLSELSRQNNVELEDIRSTVAMEDMSHRCKNTGVLDRCTTVTSQLTMLHQEEINSGRLIFSILNLTDHIMKRLEMNNDIIDVMNAGDKALETKSIVTLNGVPNRKMGTSEQEFYETVTEKVLDAILHSKQVDILNVQVSSQSIGSSRRQLQSSSSSIDITTVVTGKHRPPPDIDFDVLIDDAVNNNEEYFRDEMTDFAKDDMGNSFFSQVTSIESKSVYAKPTDVPTAEPSRLGSSTGGESIVLSGIKGMLIMVGAAIAVFAIVFGLFAFRKSRKYAKKKARSKFEDDKLFANLTGRGDIYETQGYLDAEIVTKPDTTEEFPEMDDCATTTDMTFDSKTSRRSEIRDAILSQERYRRTKDKRESVDCDGDADYYEEEDEEDEIKFRPPRIIGLGDNRGPCKNTPDEQSEITFSSGLSRKTTQQLEEEYQDRIQKKVLDHSYHSTPEFSGSRISYDRTTVRRSMLDLSSRDPYMIDEDSAVGGSNAGRSRLKMSELEAEYETRVRKKLEQGTTPSNESLSRRQSDMSSKWAGRQGDDSSSRRQRTLKDWDEERRADFRRKSLSNSATKSLDGTGRNKKFQSRKNFNLDPDNESKGSKRCEDPPADFFAKPLKFVTTSSRKNNRFKDETIISSGTNSTLSSQDFDF